MISKSWDRPSCRDHQTGGAPCSIPPLTEQGTITDIRITAYASMKNLALLVPSGRLVAMEIMHCVSMELSAVLSGMLAARGERPVVAVAIVEMMIDVPVEMFRPVEPRSRANEYAARKPLRAIVTIRRAVIRRSLVVSVRANRRLSDAYGNLCMSLLRGSHQNTRSNRH